MERMSDGVNKLINKEFFIKVNIFMVNILAMAKLVFPIKIYIKDNLRMVNWKEKESIMI